MIGRRLRPVKKCQISANKESKGKPSIIFSIVWKVEKLVKG